MKKVTQLLNRLIRTMIIPGLLFGLANASNAQSSITNYAFSASGGTYTALSGATAPGLSAGNRDEGYINTISIGFDFYYMGTRYTTVSVSTNGWMRMGGNINNATSTNNLTNGGIRPLIAPLWDDLNLNAGTMSYKTSGTAPNRTFTFEWLNAKWNFAAASAGISFQTILYETTGAIEFAYRQQAGTVNSGSASIGITANGNGNGNYLSLDGVGTSPSVSSTTETKTLNARPATGQIYRFTPPTPIDPEDLQFTTVSQTSMSLSWLDNSSDERGFVVYRSLDAGVTYSYVTTVAANTTTYTANSLSAGSEYYWLVAAITEGGTSLFIDANDFTLSPGVKIANTGTNTWSSTSAWVGGVVPGSTDSVYIPSGATVNLTTTQTCLSLQIDGTLNYVGASAARTLTVSKYLTIGSTGSFVAGTSTSTKTLNIGGTSATTYGPGTLQNDGIFDMNNGTNQVVSTNFYGNNNASISGSGSTYDFYSITVNKGTTNSRILTVSSVITMNAPTSSASRLTVTAGTFKLNSASTLTPYYGSATIAASKGRIWLNNASATLSVVGLATSASSGNVTLSGTLLIDAGTFSYGGGNDAFSIAGGSLRLNGGTLNFYGTLAFSNSITNVFNMTGGTINIDPQAADLAPSADVFYIHTNTVTSITGGIINIIDPNANSTTAKTEFIVAGTSASKNLSGLTLRLGNGSSSASGSASTNGFVLSMPTGIYIDSLIVNNPTGTDRKTKILGTSAVFAANHIKNIAGTFNLNANTLTSYSSIVNTGIMDGTVANSQLIIGGSSKQTLGGTFVSNQLSKLTINNTDTVLFTPAMNILKALTLSSGFLRSTGGLTVGAGGANTFDLIMTDGRTRGTVTNNYGTGANNFTYNGTTAQVTGTELPSTVATGTLTINNSNGVTLNAALSIQNAAFTSGKLNTTATNLLTISSSVAGAVTRTSGYVSGPLRRTLPNNAASATYIFPLGKSTDNTFEFVGLTTAGSGTGTITAEVFDANSGGSAGSGLVSISSSRYWSVSSALGSVTISSSTMRFTESGLSTSKAIGRSATLTGSYSNIGGGVVGSTIISNNNTNLNFFVIGDKATLAGGTYTVGTSGTYNSIAAVANDLNSKVVTGNVIFEMQNTYTSASEIFPINFYSFNESGGNWTATIRVQSGVSTRTIAGAPASGLPLISLNGAADITFDGRAGGTGSTSALIIRNSRSTATQGAAIEFINDASNNTIKYTQIEAQPVSATLGVIMFGSTNGTTGNDGNIIEYNTIKDYWTKLPINLIYAAGNAAATNDNNIIRYNNLYNDSIYGINLTATGMGNNWTINNNSIYNSVARNSSVAQTAIRVRGGSGHNIYNNYIGGSAANCGGSAWTNTGSINFEGINLSLGTSSVSNIYGNTINNIALTGGGTVNFNGITADGGLMNIGTSSANIIGHATTANSITTSATSGTFNGIQITNSQSASNIDNNTIANISASSASGSYTFNGIYSTGANISRNTIHSIGTTSAGLVPTISAIWHRNVGSNTHTIANNSVSLNRGSATDASMYGIFENSVGPGSVNVYYNTVQLYGDANNFSTYCLYRTSGNNMTLKNNIFYNNIDLGGSGDQVALANGNSNPAANFNSDYNVIKGTNASTECMWFTTPYDFTLYQLNSGNDDNSVNFRPTFISTTDMHLDTNYNCELNGKGSYIASATTDFDGQTRSNSRPDIGCDELLNMPLGNWFGYASTAWSNNNNWCNLTVANNTLDVEIDPSAVNQPVVSTASQTCRNLTINAGATLTLSGNNLDVVGNIVSNGTITTGSNRIILSGSSAQQVGPMTVNNIELNNSNGAQLVAASAINGTLTLTNGKVNLDSFDLTMGNSASITGYSATKYIQTLNDATTGGSLVMHLDNAGTPVVYPVGTSSFTPVRLLNNGSSAGDFKARVFNGLLANGTSGGALSSASHGVNRTWLVENVAAGTYDVTMRLQWNESDENASFYRTWCGIGHYTGGAWDADAPLPSVAGSVANSWYRERSGLTSFSPFGVGDHLTPMPIQMEQFVARAENKDAKLTWTTASELNNDYFEIERSTDGKNWTIVSTIKGQGNSNERVTYNFTDENIGNNNAVAHYRIRQNDFDGTQTLSNTASVNFGTATHISIESIQPNPFSGNININVTLNTSDQVSVRVLDMSGKEVAKQTLNLSKNNHVITMDNLNQLSNGMYLIQVSTSSETLIHRLMKN